MKRILYFVIAILISGNLFSQGPLSYRFRNPSAVNATTWRFSSVVSGIDAIVTVKSSKNATISRIDDSARYAYAWNPFIRYTSTTTNNSDSSYIEFLISFIKRSDSSSSTQNQLAMTVIDCDGTSNYREMVRASKPATSLGISGSLLTITSDSKWLTAIGSSINSSGLDTTLYSTMTQINYSNVSSFTMRVGVVGRINGGTTRQSSFYFKPFTAMSVPLAVELINFEVKSINANVKLEWATASEENMNKFEILRSMDGSNFETIAEVMAGGNSNEILKYNYTDFNTKSIPTVFYRLKIINMDGSYKMSTILKVNNTSLPVSISVYPNPSSEFITVNLSSEVEATHINIIDSYGKTISTDFNKEISTDSVLMDVRGLENGVYFVQIYNLDGTTNTVKFIKR